MPSCNSPRPGDFHRVALGQFRNPQRHVAFRLAQQAVADHAAGDFAAFGAGERQIVDAEQHRQRRRIDRLRRQRSLDFRRADRMRDGGFREARDRDDIARDGFFERQTLQAAEREHFGDTALLDQLAVTIENLRGLVRLHRAGDDAARDDAAEIRVGFQDGAEQAERPLFHGRFRHVAEHEVEQRLHALFVRAVEARVHPALFGRTIKDRKVELVVGGIERSEQVENLVERPRSAARPAGPPC